MLRLFKQIRASQLISTLADGTIRENHDTVHRLREMGGAAVPPLLRALSSDDYTTQTEAVRALGMLKDPEALGPLTEKRKHADPAMVELIDKALEKILAKHNDLEHPLAQ